MPNAERTSERPADPAEAIGAVKTRLGAMLRERRDAVAIRHSELSRRLGAPPSQIAVWMNQPHRLSLEAAVRLLWAMDARLTVGMEPHQTEPSVRSGRDDD